VSARPAPARSALLMLGTSLGVAGLSLVNVLVTSRALGVSGRGQVAFLLTVASLSAHFATLGVQEANVNTAGQTPRRTPALAGNSLVIAAVLGCAAAIGLAALVLAVPSVGGSAPRWLLWTVLATLPMLVLHLYLQQILLAHYRFGVVNTAALMSPALNTVVNCTLAVLGSLTVAATVGTWLLGQLLATLLYAVVIGRSLGGFGRPDLALAKESLHFGARAHVGRTMSWGSYRLDQWFVGVVGGDRMLGLYNVAVAWSEVLFLLPQAMQSVLRPDLVRAGRLRAQQQTATALRVGVLCLLPSALALTALAPFLCRDVLGEEFAGAVTPLRILTLGSFGVLALKVYGAALLARRRPLLDSAAAGPALVVMLLLDVLLVPWAGASGAAMAASVAYLVGGTCAVALGLRVLGGSPRDLVPRAADVRDTCQAVRAALSGRTRAPISVVAAADGADAADAAPAAGRRR
jgi:O-antigen/teichoic acid export membrane protein